MEEGKKEIIKKEIIEIIESIENEKLIKLLKGFVLAAYAEEKAGS